MITGDSSDKEMCPGKKESFIWMKVEPHSVWINPAIWLVAALLSKPAMSSQMPDE